MGRIRLQKVMPIIGISMVGIVVMLFTLPQMIGLEFTIAMALTMSVLMGIYVILVTEVIHRTALAMIGALIIIIIPKSNPIVLKSMDPITKSTLSCAGIRPV